MNGLEILLGRWMGPGLYALCFSGLVWTLARALREAESAYAQEYTAETARGFEDIFLFIPARRLLEIARISAVAVFLVFFFATGDTGSGAGLLRGLISGLFAGTGALLLPKAVLSVLRRRRLSRFNEQLVGGLLTMSNALKAGFSIIQAFESVVRERQNPIAQEFGMFLQQLRVGLAFEEALREMDRRVGSEDLTLMLLSIETARQSGGNLTEVFERIAETIRERMRLQGRIHALTAQGRLQGIVVGLMPLILFGVLSVIDPQMIQTFCQTGIGWALIALAAVLLTAGALVIRRIIRIDI